MKKNVKIPSTDLSLYSIGFGTVSAGARLEDKMLFKLLDLYVERGGNLIDSARLYAEGKSEPAIGRWLRNRGRRDGIILVTKGGHPPMSNLHASRMGKADMEFDIGISLKELGTDYIDIYFFHRDNLDQPVEESIEIMEQFVREGKIRYYGCSNWTTGRIRKADAYCKEKGYRGFVANQALFNIGSKYMNPFPDDTMVAMDEEMEAYHIETPSNLFMPYFGVCSGFFHLGEANGFDSLKGSPYYTPKNLELAAKIAQLREKYNASISQILLGFFHYRDCEMIPLYGATTVEQLTDALGTMDIPFEKEDFQI